MGALFQSVKKVRTVRREASLLIDIVACRILILMMKTMAKKVMEFEVHGLVITDRVLVATKNLLGDS